LAAARRAHEHDELPGVDLQADTVHRADAVGVDLRHLVEADAGHGALPTASAAVGGAAGSPRRPDGRASPCARLSSSQSASISSSVSVAAVFGSSMAAWRISSGRSSSAARTVSSTTLTYVRLSAASSAG